MLLIDIAKTAGSRQIAEGGKVEGIYNRTTDLFIGVYTAPFKIRFDDKILIVKGSWKSLRKKL